MVEMCSPILMRKVVVILINYMSSIYIQPKLPQFEYELCGWGKRKLFKIQMERY